MKFKTELIKTRYKFLCETIQEIAYEMAEWCEDEKIPFLVTETVTSKEEDFELKRVSATHRTARAIDVSTKVWTEDQRKSLAAHFNPRFQHVAALSIKTGEPKLIIYHDSGHGAHLHIQVGTPFAIYDPLKNKTEPVEEDKNENEPKG